ncbi:MAG TPA: P1 family peptidase [Casimicrobiaceae bacterium]|nr:P1 family peptidase [Casimicrobiaceae bacterium]
MFDAPRIGTLDSGSRNSIADVEGVSVGHATLADGAVQTGVTVVRPHPGDVYREPLPAASVVLNGFGKTMGLVQLDELGLLESPIALTNTFAVGTVATAMIRRAIAANPSIGRTSPTLNPVVAECNDGWLNDLQAFAIRERHYAMAFDAATADFAQGSVGAGRGMSCFELKGGVGSASRATSDGANVVGALVLANFGKLSQLTLRGVPLGCTLTENARASSVEQGSLIVVLATDAPLEHRQLRRLALRAGAGIARTGSNFGHGSGDIVIAFSTAERLARGVRAAKARRTTPDEMLDPLFDAAAEATEQAIVNALFAAETVEGYAGHRRRAITERVPDWQVRLGNAEDQ